MAQDTVTLRIDNIIPGKDLFEFWIPCTKELCSLDSEKIHFTSKDKPSTISLANKKLLLNIHLDGSQVRSHMFSIPPSHFHRYPVCLGSRRIDIRSGRIMGEVYFVPHELEAKANAPSISYKQNNDEEDTNVDKTNVRIAVETSDFKIVSNVLNPVKPPTTVEIGTLYTGSVVTDEWLQQTYTRILFTLGRIAPHEDDEVDEEDEFQELLMIVCSETLTRGVYVKEHDRGCHTFSNGLSPCVMSKLDCAVGVYQIYMSIYFDETFTSPGSLRMHHVANKLGYPMLSAGGEMIIFRQRDEAHEDRVFHIPYNLTESTDITRDFSVFGARELTHELHVYCHARTLLSSEQNIVLSYTYSFPNVVPQHKLIDPKQLCFVRPIIPLEPRKDTDPDSLHHAKNYPIDCVHNHYNSLYPTIFVPRLLKHTTYDVGTTFISYYGKGFCINSSYIEEESKQDVDDE